MRLYVEVARRTYARVSTYRSATLAGVFTNTVFGFLLAYILLAVYRDRTDVGGFDAIDAVTFTFVAQGMLMVLGMFNDTEIADRISTGDVVVDLQRPYDHQAWWAGVSYGKAAYYVRLPRRPAVPRRRHRVPPPASVAQGRGRVRGERRAGGRRRLRLAVPAAAHRLLAARRAGREPARLVGGPVPLRRVPADRVLPRLARDDGPGPAVRVDAPAPGGDLARSLRRRRAPRGVRPPGGMGARRSSSPGAT